MSRPSKRCSRRSRARHPLPLARCHFFEPLEDRRLLACDVFVDDQTRTLFVKGDELDNRIAIRRESAELLGVYCDDVTTLVKQGQIAVLQIKAGGGDDTVDTQDEQQHATYVWGEDGDDTWHHGPPHDVNDDGFVTPADSLIGGGGHDKIIVTTTDLAEFVKIIGIGDLEFPDPEILVTTPTDAAGNLAERVLAHLFVQETEAVTIQTCAGDDRVEMEDRLGLLAGIDWLIETGGGDDDVVAGLLSPAVQKVQEPVATKVTLDLGGGNDDLQFRSKGFGLVDLNVSAGAGDDEVVIGLLLPAVQKVRGAAAMAKVMLDLGEGDDQLKLSSRGFQQVDLGLSAGSGDDDALIGLLLPAVQKVRRAAATATMQLDLGEGNNQLKLQSIGLAQVDLDVTAGEGDDNVVIGLLLPAVQKVRDSSALVNVDLGTGNNFQKVRTRGFAVVDRTSR